MKIRAVELAATVYSSPGIVGSLPPFTDKKPFAAPLCKPADPFPLQVRAPLDSSSRRPSSGKSLLTYRRAPSPRPRFPPSLLHAHSQRTNPRVPSSLLRILQPQHPLPHPPLTRQRGSPPSLSRHARSLPSDGTLLAGWG